ncbi:rCG54678 [Rattus norvegicus]|uniref:RCG54678 n=1 Tax=Rattus norvegicus TaxID=10116 RepID=A6KFM5_RAT|nr:rCG54678 [Rattus norvegicus]
MPLPWDAGCAQPAGCLSYFTLPGNVPKKTSESLFSAVLL